MGKILFIIIRNKPTCSDDRGLEGDRLADDLNAVQLLAEINQRSVARILGGEYKLSVVGVEVDSF